MIQNSTAPGIPHLHGRRLAIRADAGPDIGTGHVMRCLALAEGWGKAGGMVTLVSRALPSGLAARAASLGIAVEAAGDDRGGRWAEAADLAIIDGWSFTTEQIEAAARHTRLLAIDDTAGLPSIAADIVLNPNVYATAEAYRGRTHARLLIGPSYALLRREFAAVVPERRYPAIARALLLLLGGADPANASVSVLAAARMARSEEPGIERITLVVGAANPRYDALAVETENDTAVEVLKDVQAMAPLMDAADLAISAGGSTVLELAARGTPMLLGALIAEEEQVIGAMRTRDAARTMGRFDAVSPNDLCDALLTLARDPAARQALSTTAQGLVDGRGVERAIAACLEVTA